MDKKSKDSKKERDFLEKARTRCWGDVLRPEYSLNKLKEQTLKAFKKKFK